MFECASCSEEFYDQDDCDEHMDDEDHWIECDTCTRQFRSYRACNQHMNDTGHHAPQFKCDTCTATFPTSNAVNQHMRDKCHRKNFCYPCDRLFQNDSNYNAHMNSKRHRGTNVECPFCDAKFVTASGAAHHLERGACPNARQVNRETIFHALRQLDPSGRFTNKQIEWHGEQSVQYSVTSAAFDGAHWVCYICQKRFNTSRGLEQHLNSSTHQADMYHCLNRGCPKNFKNFAAFFNHLESESCGFARFETVQNYHCQLSDVVQGRRLITGLFH